MIATFLRDLRFALRNLRRTPAVPIAAIVTLGLGIGATTAIFSILNTVLLRPLPYPRPEALYSLRTTLTDGRVTTGLLSGSEILRLNTQTTKIERAVGITPQEVTLLKNDGTPLHVDAPGVSEGFFEMFGLPLTVGPGFTKEHFARNAQPVVVISYPMWVELFGRDPSVVGKPIRFAEITTTVAGVAPRDFDTPHGAEFWVNQRTDDQDVGHTWEGFMRIKPGATRAQAEGEMSTVIAGLARDYPTADLNRVYVVRTMVEQLVGDLRPILLIVLSATGLLLLLACVNVTNLLLARGAARAREMAVRVALGAPRGRLIGQMLTESVLLSTIGAVVGLLIASIGVRLLLAIGAARLPRLETVTFDARVLLFAMAALVVSGLFVGFAPAMRLARTDVRTLMNEAGRSASGGPGTARWLGGMAIAEIALAITLVAAAGWLIIGFARLQATDPGFAPKGRLIFDVSFFGPKYRDVPAMLAAGDDLAAKLKSIHGVTGAGATSNFPLVSGTENSLFVQLQGETLDPRSPRGSRQRSVSPGFFDAAGIKLVSGRDFTADDRQDTLRVVVVNRTFVKRHLPDRNPIGVVFGSGYPTIFPNSETTIVGVVDDVRQKSLTDAPEPAFYSPISQAARRRLTWIVSTNVADPASVEKAIREEIRGMDPEIAIDFEAVPELVRSTLSRQELGMTLMLLFGAVAVALAAVGVYGVIAYAASQRTGEVATRLALGATQGNVFWLVMKQGRMLAAAGLSIGLILAYVAGRLVSSRVYEVRASDPLVLGGGAAIVVVIAIVATIIPAYRASRLNPARVLRPD